MARAARGVYNGQVSVPTGFTVFPGELWRTPRSWVERTYPNLIYFNEVDKAGTSPRVSSRSSLRPKSARRSDRSANRGHQPDSGLLVREGVRRASARVMLFPNFRRSGEAERFLDSRLSADQVVTSARRCGNHSVFVDIPGVGGPQILAAAR
jgi:hypothetical protein